MKSNTQLLKSNAILLCALLNLSACAQIIPWEQVQTDVLAHALVQNCEELGLKPQLQLQTQKENDNSEVMVSGQLKYTGERKIFRSEIAYQSYCWRSALNIQARYTQQANTWQLEELEAIPTEAQSSESEQYLKAIP